MDLRLSEVLKKAADMGVVDGKITPIIEDYIRSCDARIQKNIDMVNRLIGQNEQLRLNSSIMTDVLKKYITIQESIDAAQREKDEMLAKEETLEDTELPEEETLKAVIPQDAKKTKKATKRLAEEVTEVK